MVINTHGSQVVDTWPSQHDLREFMSMEHSRASMLKITPGVAMPCDEPASADPAGRGRHQSRRARYLDRACDGIGIRVGAARIMRIAATI